MTPNRRLLDADILLNHLETEEVKLIQLYPKNAYGIRKVISRLKFFIADGQFDAPPSLDRQAVELLREVRPYIAASADATHMMDGFKPRTKNYLDELVDKIDAVIESGRVE